MEIKPLVHKLNKLCKKALEQGAAVCVSRTHFTIELEHFLYALVDMNKGDWPLILQHYNISVPTLRQQLFARLERLKTGNNRTPSFGEPLLEALYQGWMQSSLFFNGLETRSGTILLALVENLPQEVESIAPLLGQLSPAQMKRDFPDLIGASSTSEEAVNHGERSVSEPIGETPNLDLYTINLTAQAIEGKIDPVIGRHEHIQHLIEVLGRRRQNNPIITGEAGVGKTSLVEGLALRIASGKVPPFLKNAQLRTLDLGLLQAGAGVKGEFENRLNKIINEIKTSLLPIILFIDEAHTLIGSGNNPGQADAANLLKPALARGELRTIAATTWAEYKRYFEKDAALSRRFEVVKVDEPDEETAIDMLRGMVPSLQKHHQVEILDEAVIEAVVLSQRYIPERRLPDKALSVLDTACAQVRATRFTPPMPLQDLMAEKEKIQRAIPVSSIERRVLLVTRLQKTEEQLKTLERQWQAERRETSSSMEKTLVPEKVNGYVVSKVVSSWTGIPTGRLLHNEAAGLLTLQGQLEKRIRGQSAGLQLITQRLQAYRAHLESATKPVGVFLLLGPSGVGKTETALTLAEMISGHENALITLNMSEYQEVHSVSTLRGAPPGYVGYGRGGTLTEAVRHHPYGVVLLDEVEKAHPDVLEIFYQVFDKGVLEDGEGVEVNFRNTILILTSNVMADVVEENIHLPFEDLQRLVCSQLHRHLPVAFLSRLTVIPYTSLDHRTLKDIVDLQLRKLGKKIQDHYQGQLTYDTEALSAFLPYPGCLPSGARYIDHAITHFVVNPLAQDLLEMMSQHKQLKKVHIALTKEGNIFYTLEEVQ